MTRAGVGVEMKIIKGNDFENKCFVKTFNVYRSKTGADAPSGVNISQATNQNRGILHR